MTETTIHFTVLFVDDEPNVRKGFVRALRNAPYRILTAASGPEAITALEETPIHMVVVDLFMPGMSGLEVLKAVRERWPEISVTVISGHGGIADAVEAMRLGAKNFLEKPVSLEKIRAELAQEHRLWQLTRENERLRAELERQFLFDRMIGNSPLMSELKRNIVHLATTDANVLIHGETGTGKELVAESIHFLSGRRHKAFVPVDCAALTSSLIESELFGHERGAFTGALASRTGLFQTADGGTVFLDEVGELPLDAQAKFLRVLQVGEVRRVGSSHPDTIDVRVIAATHRDLEARAQTRSFREDLYFRLSVVTLRVPPLRERQGDIPLLARHFLNRFASDNPRVRDIAPGAYPMLEAYSWPGNVRELEHTVRRALIFCGGDVVTPADIEPHIGGATGAAAPLTLAPAFATPAIEGDRIEDYERAAIRNALEKTGGHREKAAALLDVSPATLFRKLARYGLK